MLKLISSLLWLIFLLVLLLGFDWMMVKLPQTSVPVLQQTQTFYVDLRQRMIGLFTAAGNDQRQTASQPVKKEEQATSKTSPPKQTGQSSDAQDQIARMIEGTTNKPAAQQKAQRYLYADHDGGLHFADNLSEIPEEYRGSAQPLAAKE